MERKTKVYMTGSRAHMLRYQFTGRKMPLQKLSGMAILVSLQECGLCKVVNQYFWVGHLNVAYMTTFLQNRFRGYNGVLIEAPLCRESVEETLEMVFNEDEVHGGMPSNEESDLG